MGVENLIQLIMILFHSQPVIKNQTLRNLMVWPVPLKNIWHISGLTGSPQEHLWRICLVRCFVDKKIHPISQRFCVYLVDLITTRVNPYVGRFTKGFSCPICEFKEESFNHWFSRRLTKVKWKCQWIHYKMEKPKSPMFRKVDWTICSTNVFKQSLTRDCHFHRD